MRRLREGVERLESLLRRRFHSFEPLAMQPIIPSKTIPHSMIPFKRVFGPGLKGHLPATSPHIPMDINSIATKKFKTSFSAVPLALPFLSMLIWPGCFFCITTFHPVSRALFFRYAIYYLPRMRRGVFDKILMWQHCNSALAGAIRHCVIFILNIAALVLFVKVELDCLSFFNVDIAQ